MIRHFIPCFAAAVTSFALSLPAIASTLVLGSASGVFINPQPSDAVVTGVGTSTFTFGQGLGSPPNKLDFNGTSFNTSVNTPFDLGTLTYFNGTTGAGSNATSVDLKVTTLFTNPNLGNVASTFDLNLVSTPNVGNADQNADYVYLPSAFSSNVFNINGTAYTVQLVGFENVVGDGFLDSTSTQLHVREGSSASAQLFAEVTSVTAAVPESSTWAMMIFSFSGLGLMVYRRKQTRPALRLAV